MLIVKYVIITLGIILALLGLFHQLIVGGVVTRLVDSEEKDLRLYMMSWISHGAYLLLSGILGVILLTFHSPWDSSLKTSLFILSFANLFLSIHIAFSALKTQITIITLEFFFSLIFSIFLFIYYFFL